MKLTHYEDFIPPLSMAEKYNVFTDLAARVLDLTDSNWRDQDIRLYVPEIRFLIYLANGNVADAAEVVASEEVRKGIGNAQSG